MGLSLEESVSTGYYTDLMQLDKPDLGKSFEHMRHTIQANMNNFRSCSAMPKVGDITKLLQSCDARDDEVASTRLKSYQP